MDPISNVDHLVLVLRQRLLERARPDKRARGERKERGLSGLQNLQALAAIEAVDDRQLKRALIQSILVEQFGEQMINEPRFQQVVARVAEAIDTDPAGGAMLSGLVKELRASAP